MYALFTVGHVWIYGNLWSKSHLLLVGYMYRLFPKCSPIEHRSSLASNHLQGGFIHPSNYLWRYSPFLALASLIRRLPSSLFAAFFLHPLVPSSCSASLWTTSTHLILSLPSGRVVWKFLFRTFSGIHKADTSYYCQYEGDKCRIVIVHHIKAYRGHRSLDPLIFKLSTRWRWIVSFTLRLLYPGKEPRY